jgi:Fe-S-cluster containining protein
MMMMTAKRRAAAAMAAGPPRARARAAAAAATTVAAAALRRDTGGDPTAASAAASALAAATAAGDPSLAPFISQVQGKAFTCTQCGKCCTGKGDVWVTEEEALAIARRTRRPQAAFTKSRSPALGWRLLRDRPRDPLGACFFLSKDDDRTCTIHDVRPGQCRLYPWWPGLMEPAEWGAEAEAVCEGFDHPDAPPLEPLDAARQLREAAKLEAMREMAARRRGGGGVVEVGVGARSAADMPARSRDGEDARPTSSAPPGEVAGGGTPSPRARGERKTGDLYGRLMALLQEEEESSAEGEGRGGRGRGQK